MHQFSSVAAVAEIPNFSATFWAVASACKITPASDNAFSAIGKKIGAIARWTNKVSAALQTLGPSFTIDTVEAVAKSYPDDQIALIIGTDAFAKIDQWHRTSELQDMVEFIVIDRPEFPGEHSLDIGALNISATRVRAGDLASVSTHVATYIKEHDLYASK